MKFFKYNLPAAWIVLVIAVAVSAVFGTNRSVSRLEEETVKAYAVDSTYSGSAKADMIKFADYASQLYAIAEATGCADAAFGSALSELRASMDSPFGSEDAFSDLHSAASLAYNKIVNQSDVTETQKKSAILYYYEMDSTKSRLSNNAEYNKIAAKYNAAIASFPASVFAPGRACAAVFG